MAPHRETVAPGARHPLARGVLPWALALSACGEEPALLAASPGEPIPGLAREELSRFEEGRQLFQRPFTPEEGLGPLFNQDRCSSCHDLPTSGGAGAERVTKATRYDAPGPCDLLGHEGGDNVQARATPLLRALGFDREPAPPSATTLVDLSPPPRYGLGLMEAVADRTLRAREDPLDEDGDGVSGRAAPTASGRVGRFGRKASHATLASFVEEALRTEMGLTTPDHPTEETLGGSPLPPGADPAPDPEVDRATIERLAEYVRLLAPPERALPAARAARDTVAEGERIFGAIGCTRCHVPELETGDHEVAALERRTFALYSDLLLHDMGPGLAAECGSAASPTEFRTAPLLGLRHRDFLLHDGRARSPEAAVAAHGGEAEGARRAFQALGAEARSRLLRFLDTL